MIYDVCESRTLGLFHRCCLQPWKQKQLAFFCWWSGAFSLRPWTKKVKNRILLIRSIISNRPLLAFSFVRGWPSLSVIPDKGKNGIFNDCYRRLPWFRADNGTRRLYELQIDTHWSGKTVKNKSMSGLVIDWWSIACLWLLKACVERKVCWVLVCVGVGAYIAMYREYINSHDHNSCFGLGFWCQVSTSINRMECSVRT